MPKSLALLHNLLIDAYIKKGYSKLFYVAQEVMFINKEGFLKAGNLLLANLFDNVEDYVMTGALMKVKESTDFILFDSAGKILGISKEIYKALILEEGIEINLEFFLERAYIYFWMPFIFDIIAESKEELTNLDFGQVSSLKKGVVFSFKNFNQLINEY
jgi:hypothetical protein